MYEQKEKNPPKNILKKKIFKDDVNSFSSTSDICFMHIVNKQKVGGGGQYSSQ
jgi:hypothetical protein